MNLFDTYQLWFIETQLCLIHRWFEKILIENNIVLFSLLCQLVIDQHLIDFRETVTDVVTLIT